MIVKEDFTTESLASGATVIVKIGAPRGAIMRRLVVLASATSSFDAVISTENSATPAAKNVYQSSLAVTTLSLNTFTNAYLAAPAFYLILKNNHASAQTFDVLSVHEEPPVSY